MTANCHTLFLEFICLRSVPLLIQHNTVNCLLGIFYMWKSCEVLPHHLGLTFKLIPSSLGLSWTTLQICLTISPVNLYADLPSKLDFGLGPSLQTWLATTDIFTTATRLALLYLCECSGILPLSLQVLSWSHQLLLACLPFYSSHSCLSLIVNLPRL